MPGNTAVILISASIILLVGATYYLMLVGFGKNNLEMERNSLLTPLPPYSTCFIYLLSNGKLILLHEHSLAWWRPDQYSKMQTLTIPTEMHKRVTGELYSALGLKAGKRSTPISHIPARTPHISLMFSISSRRRGDRIYYSNGSWETDEPLEELRRATPIDHPTGDLILWSESTKHMDQNTFSAVAEILQPALKSASPAAWLRTDLKYYDPTER